MTAFSEGQPVEVKRLIFNKRRLPTREWSAATVTFQLTRDRYGVTLRSGPRSVFNIENIRAA